MGVGWTHRPEREADMHDAIGWLIAQDPHAVWAVLAAVVGIADLAAVTLERIGR